VPGSVLVVWSSESLPVVRVTEYMRPFLLARAQAAWQTLLRYFQPKGLSLRANLLLSFALHGWRNNCTISLEPLGGPGDERQEQVGVALGKPQEHACRAGRLAAAVPPISQNARRNAD
jgi:hypothetical protein